MKSMDRLQEKIDWMCESRALDIGYKNTGIGFAGPCSTSSASARETHSCDDVQNIAAEWLDMLAATQDDED